MTTTIKEKLEGILKAVKVAFDAAPIVTPMAAPVIAPAMNMASFPIDGGVPVFVDITDDGIADIDVNDAVFTDEAMTIPYPDGTYSVTGTDVSFTVALGLVISVADADGTGAADAAISEEDFAACLAKFGTGTTDEKVSNLEKVTKHHVAKTAKMQAPASDPLMSQIQAAMASHKADLVKSQSENKALRVAFEAMTEMLQTIGEQKVDKPIDEQPKKPLTTFQAHQLRKSKI